jgi:glycosyltransferase involved in cell wall biosynthesis
MIAASVLIATYNQDRFLARAVTSALRQRLPSGCFEVIVVDDGSTDTTPEILRGFAGSVRLVRQPNRGLPAARNAGLAAARGETLLVLDSDDELEPDALATEWKALRRHPEAAVACPDRWEIGEDGRLSRQTVDLGQIYGIIAAGLLFRTEVVRALGGYRSFYWEEHDLMIRLRRQCPAVHVPVPLYRYYRHGDNMTCDAAARRQGWADLIREWGMNELQRWGEEPEMEAVAAEMESLRG